MTYCSTFEVDLAQVYDLTKCLFYAAKTRYLRLSQPLQTNSFLGRNIHGKLLRDIDGGSEARFNSDWLGMK